MWGATIGKSTLLAQLGGFQSAHPYVGCDIQCRIARSAYSYFNPRTPMWGATWFSDNLTTVQGFQSAHPYVGCDDTF